MDNPPGKGTYAQSEKKRHIEHAHGKTFPPRGGDVPHICLDNGQNHGRRNALNKSQNNQCFNGVETEKYKGNDGIGKQAGNDKRFTPFFIGKPSEIG